MFTEKYKPEILEEVIGQNKAVGEILEWFDSWEPGDKALLIHGPTGVGKTSIAYALASEKNMDFIEINASDYRSAKQIKGVMGSSVNQKSLFKTGKVFIIDEIDGLSGRSDRGGVSQIVKLIKETKYPIILTANDPYDSKFKTLRKYCKLVQLRRLHVRSIENKLKDIVEGEGIEIERVALRQLAKMSDGDLRAAINDLESLRSKKITFDNVDILDKRERGISVFKSLGKIYRADDIRDARKALDSSDKSIDEMFWWIETNIIKEFNDPEEIASAYDALSKADIFKGMIRKTNNWRFFAYFVDMITGGVASSKKKKRHRFVRYGYPTMISTLGRTKAIRRKQDERLEELSEKLHCSKEKVRTQFLPYLDIIESN